MFTSLSIKNFRGFKDLKVEPLDRVNLIAGKNDGGKTSVLEGLYLHCHPTNTDAAVNVLRLRGVLEPKIENVAEWLFLGASADTVAEISTRDNSDNVRISELRLADSRNASDPDFARVRELVNHLPPEYVSQAGRTLVIKFRDSSDLDVFGVGIASRHGGSTVAMTDKRAPITPVVFLNSRDKIASTEQDAGEYAANVLFDDLDKAGRQEEVLIPMQQLEPRLRGLSFNIFNGKTVIHGELEGVARKVPLPLMGEGVSRLLMILSAVANAPHGVVLVDEIENGLHYSVLVDVWKAVAVAARRLDVQVFATTHSWECIRAADEAFSGSDPYDLRLHRLDRLNGDVRSTTYDPRPPVFILVCKNTKLAKVIYEWLAEDKPPTGLSSVKIDLFRNTPDRINTIRVDSKVVTETDTDNAKSDEHRWMRFTLDTVGKTAWPADRQGRPQYPEGFEEVAAKLKKPLHPPGRDVRCIVSVGMLTEGWDCSTVTHIVGLRPFMSQLLCEQVVGRGLRRRSYDDFDEQGHLKEEVAKVFGVPFDVVPFKANPAGAATKPDQRKHVYAVPEKAQFEIRFPRVEGYTQAIRNRISMNWEDVPSLVLDPLDIPAEVQVKGMSVTNEGRMSLNGPGRIDNVTLAEFRAKRRIGELSFDLARGLTRTYLSGGQCTVPPQALFPQVLAIVKRYLADKVTVRHPADLKDAFLSPYYGWLVERLVENIHGDSGQGETHELPRYEANREAGSTADVDFWTSRPVREVLRSHLNYVVADTRVWEQSAAYFIDNHAATDAFVKNSGLGFAIPYLHNGQQHEYLPDFIVRLKGAPGDVARHVILETKGYDALEEVKAGAAHRWVDAVNADGRHGIWHYRLGRRPEDVVKVLSSFQ